MKRALPTLGCVLLLSGCGGKDGTADSAPTATDSAPPKKKKDKEQCLKIGTLTMDMQYGWNNKDAVTRPIINTTSGLPARSTFRVNLGSRDWDGDTSLPGQPDRWCFVEWNLDGVSGDGGYATSILSLSGMDPGKGTTNCGRESSPMASDFVEVCDDFFGDENPVQVLSAMDWRFKFGGPVGSSVSGIPYYFQSAGYTEDNFWGSTAASDFFNPIETLTYGWQVDAYGATILDEENAPLKWTRADAEGPDGLPDGLYFHVIPWIFPI